MEKGTLILARRTLNADHSSFGIGIFNADSEEKDREIVHNDPAVRKKVMRGELYPYGVALLKAENAQGT